MGDETVAAAEVNAQADGHVCIVCFSDLGTNMRAKLPCGHDSMCGICHLRLRYLHDDKKCPICKQTNDSIIVDNDETKSFDDYPRWGDEIGAGFVFKKDVGMFFEETYYKKSIVPLYEYSCHKCKFKVDDSIFVNQHLQNDDNDNNKGGTRKRKKPRRLLLDHMRAKHRLQMCTLCIDHKRDFISQLPRFTASQLQNHMKNGDGPGSGFNGHPICEFCRPKRFYDVNFLYQHLHKEHYKCHICEKQGKDNQWFKNYSSLARHFERHHFLCNHPQCLEARFVVFENELDLKAHEIAVHGGTSSGSTKINLEFQYRRANATSSQHQNAPSESDFNYDLDGQAFVPPALTNENNNNTNNGSTNSNNPNNESLLHPQHVQRTEELRAQAAVVRQQQALNSAEESFPTLQATEAPAPSSAPLFGWTTGTTLQNINRSNRNVGEVTQESFPSLQSNSSNNKKKKVIKGNLGATRRQFAAMTTSANNQQQQASWGENRTGAAIGSMASSSLSNTNQSNNYFFPTTAARHSNRQSDLAPDNFPSLGGPSSSSMNASTNASTRQNYQRKAVMAPPPPPSMSSVSDFPSMQSTSRNSSAARVNKKNLKPPPSISSASDFPAPPSMQRTMKPTARQQILGETERKRPPDSNVLNANIPSSASSAKATIEDMKVSLGQNNFKQLKKLTKNFAQEQISPEGYIDQAATLFEGGYEDKDFWSYLPSLLESCPNQGSAQHALKYMNSLKRQQKQSNNHSLSAASRVTATPSQWGGASTNVSNVMRQVVPPPLPASRTSPRPLTQPVATAMRPQIISSKKKSSWGAGGNSTILRTKAPPGSVGAAAATQGPQGGSATKYMANQQKKQQQSKNNGNNNQQKKTKKKKQKNELRDLAFGK